jgi:hypothetical protein
VTYSVQANPGTGSRSTTLTIAGNPNGLVGYVEREFTVNQLNGCVFGLTPSSAAFASGGGTGSIAVGASDSGCTLTATSNAFWLTVNGPVIGSGNSTVGYSVSPNSSTTGRTGTLTVAGQTFTAVEAGATCSFALAQASQAFTASGGTGTAAVQAPAGCFWTAQSNSPFVTITGGASGSGNGTVSYAVQLNSAGTPRTGSLTIAALPYAVSQAGTSPLNCTALVTAPALAAIEGRTEVLGDLQLSCTGFSGVLIADISLTLNTNVTNTLTGNTADASLLVNESNRQPGVISGYNTLHWPGVSLVTGNGGAAAVRITNVRADASLLGAPANLQSIPLTGVVSVSAAVAVPVTNASQIMAYAGPSLVFQKGVASPAGGGAQTTIPLQYQEASAAAFHAAGIAPATRLRLVVSNVPSTVQVFAPVFPSEGVTRAQLYSADVNGLGGSPVAGVSGYQQLAVSGGVATATWVVLSADPGQFETDTFPLLLQNATATNLSQIQMAASVGPVSSVSVASATAPVPRYRDFSVTQSVVNLRATTMVQVQANVSSAIFSNHAKTTSRLSSAVVGSNATFTNQLTNDNQDQTATGVVIRDKVTGGGNIQSCQATGGGNCTMSGNEAVMTYASLAPAQGVTITLQVQADPSLPDGSVVQNLFSTASDQPNADISGSSASSSFIVTGVPGGNGGNPPASIVASGGTPQSATVGAAFSNALQVTVTDSSGQPVSGVVVTFTAPASGASAVLSSGTGVTNTAGVASVTATANGTSGSYTVTAGVGALSASFSLTNLPSGGGNSDLARGKAATQSSTLPGYASAGAGSAVDGNSDGSFGDGSVTATNLDGNAWWQVDLGSSTAIGSIAIWNRTDCCGTRLSDYWVFVSDTPFGAADTPGTLQFRAGTWSSHQTSAPNPSTTIVAGTQGRYLRVQLTNAGYLSLAEVQVFGPAAPSSANLAVGKAATQSSTLPGYATAGAGSAVDGSTDGSFGDGSVTATNLDANAWWQVDLGASTAIGSITIWNRVDCCGTRLSDYWVFVSDTPFGAADTPGTLQIRAGTWSSHQTLPPNPSTTIAAGTQGRYVRVQLSAAGYLSLAEVQVFGPAAAGSSNLAQGKTATQSSTLPGYAGAGASSAVDGSTDGSFGDGW